MNKSQPIKTLPKPKPNLVTKKPEGDGVYNGKQKLKGKQAKANQHKPIKTVKHLDGLFSKEFRF